MELLGLSSRGSWEAPGGGGRQPQLHNHVLPSAGCTQCATSTLCTPDIVRLLVTSWSGGGRQGERLERLWWRWLGSGGGPAPRAAQTTPRFSRRHESAGQAPSRSLRSVRTRKLLLFRLEAEEEGKLVALEPWTWSASQLQQAFGGCQCQQQ